MAQGSMGSQTQTQTNTPTDSGGEGRAVLRLRGAHGPRTRRSIHWAEDVVDNEGLGRKSSKGTYESPHLAALGMLAPSPAMGAPALGTPSLRDVVS